MLQPWIAEPEYRRLTKVTDKLVETMHKYKEYLDTKNEQMKVVYKQMNVEVTSDVLKLCTL